MAINIYAGGKAKPGSSGSQAHPSAAAKQIN
jgi:hypothetical protein